MAAPLSVVILNRTVGARPAMALSTETNWKWIPVNTDDSSGTVCAPATEAKLNSAVSKPGTAWQPEHRAVLSAPAPVTSIVWVARRSWRTAGTEMGVTLSMTVMVVLPSKVSVSWQVVHLFFVGLALCLATSAPYGFPAVSVPRTWHLTHLIGVWFQGVLLRPEMKG